MIPSKEELDAIEKRCNEAADGPWEFEGDKKGHTYLVGKVKTIITLSDEYDGYPECGQELRMEIDEPDREFIIHSRTDISMLIEAVRELQEKNAKHVLNAIEYEGKIIDIKEELDTCRRWLHRAKRK